MSVGAELPIAELQKLVAVIATGRGIQVTPTLEIRPVLGTRPSSHLGALGTAGAAYSRPDKCRFVIAEPAIAALSPASIRWLIAHELTHFQIRRLPVLRGCLAVGVPLCAAVGILSRSLLLLVIAVALVFIAAIVVRARLIRREELECDRCATVDAGSAAGIAVLRWIDDQMPPTRLPRWSQRVFGGYPQIPIRISALTVEGRNSLPSASERGRMGEGGHCDERGTHR